VKRSSIEEPTYNLERDLDILRLVLTMMKSEKQLILSKVVKLVMD